MRDSQRKYAKIYDRYVKKIYRFIFLKVNSPEVAEDLTSEVFLRGWESFKSGEKIENIQAFLYQIARNLVTDFYREKGRAQVISAEWEMIDLRKTPEEKALLSSDLKIVREALDRIPDSQREVIILRYVNDLSIKEIAQILDKSEEAVRVSLHRALQALKKEISM